MSDMLTKKPTWEPLKEQYDLSIEALSRLGFIVVATSTVPTYEAVQNVISPDVAQFLNMRRSQGHRDELVISPSVQEIGLHSFAEINSMRLPRDRHRTPGLLGVSACGVRLTAEGSMISSYGNTSPLHDNGANSSFTTAVLLGDISKPPEETEHLCYPHGTQKQINKYAEPGLVYTRIHTSRQRATFNREIENQAQQGRQIKSVTAAQMFVVAVQRKIAGLTSFNPETVTSLAHYPVKPKRRFAFAPFMIPGISTEEGAGLIKVMCYYANDRGYDNLGIRRTLILHNGIATPRRKANDVQPAIYFSSDSAPQSAQFDDDWWI